MIRIGKLRITGNFLLLIAWMNYLDRQQIVPMALLACALHEAGHLLVLRWYKKDIKEINITLIGAEIRSVGSMGYYQEGVAALAGPGINLLLALAFCRVPWGAMFSGINLILACFNLLPIGTLDGGRALRATMSLVISADTAKAICNCFDRIFSGVVLMAGCNLFFYSGNMTLLLIALWLLSSVVRPKVGN